MRGFANGFIHIAMWMKGQAARRNLARESSGSLSGPYFLFPNFVPQGLEVTRFLATRGLLSLWLFQGAMRAVPKQITNGFLGLITRRFFLSNLSRYS